ncbi:hypothetical protein WN944_007439 [Citrus x changshan-huyou]|uniref:Uncharacterized protein n=1 Tax=Citrus x changshan-huyou TaxID=2935761 RepID=A0AAP0ML14_9ROSI
MLPKMSRQLVGKDATRWWQSPNNVLMRCSEIEEGSLITSSLISNSGASITSYDSNDQLQNDKRYSPDPVTLRVIFSSLVAACGSYVYGHAVSVYNYIYIII